MAEAGAHWAALFDDGVFTDLSGPPAATAMPRVTLTANHDESDLDRILDACDRLDAPRENDIPPVTLTR